MNQDQHSEKFIAYKKLMGEQLCSLCNRFFKNKGFTEHKRHCEKRGGDWSQEEVIRGPYLCKFCGCEWPTREARNGHQIKCKLNPERESCIEKISKSCMGREMSEEVKEKISISMKEYKAKCKEMGDKIVGKTNIKDTEGDTIELFFTDEL